MGRGAAARAALALALALAPLAAAALDPAVEAALAPPPGALATHDEDRGLDAFALPVAPHGGATAMLRPVEGAVRLRAWRAAGAEGTLALARRLRDRLAPLGFRTTLFCAGPTCGGYDFRYALEVLPQPAMAVNLADFRQLTMTRDEADGTLTAVSLLASRLGGVTHLQLATVEGAVDAADAPRADAPSAASPAPAAAAPADDAAPDAPAPAPPETAATAPGAAPADAADALLARLRAEGRAALEGVAFLPGAATLAPESGPALDAAAAALAAAPDLVAAVVGHTDATGALGPNLRVSAARAEAVRAALVARGVAPRRLEAHGAGWLAPRAPNDDEAGRARNRRVELVVR